MSAAAALKRKKSYHSSAVPISAPMATLFACLTLSSSVALNSAAAVGALSLIVVSVAGWGVGDESGTRRVGQVACSEDTTCIPWHTAIASTECSRSDYTRVG